MNSKSYQGDIKDPSLINQGIQRINWAAREMPVLQKIRTRFQAELPLKNIRIAGCLHVTSETANLMVTLKAAGADIQLAASNPLSTQDDIAAALSLEYDVPTYAIRGEDNDTYHQHLEKILDFKPQLTMDDGADLVALLHSKDPKESVGVVGGTEETTTGVIRLRALANEGNLRYPIIAVNDANTKHFFDNRYGTGQSTLDGIIRATNILLAGKTLVVSGYGWCGKGLALRGKGMGARVIITEVNPLRALEAVMDGFQVLPMYNAAQEGDIFVTVTGDINVLDYSSFQLMKSGAILANSGHFDSEINLPVLNNISESKHKLSEFMEEYTLPDGRQLIVLAEGRLVNLGAAEGHPASVMDMSFANQALSLEYMAQEHKKLKPNVYEVPSAIDDEIAKLKLDAMGINIDSLTEEQENYLNSWTLGT